MSKSLNLGPAPSTREPLGPLMSHSYHGNAPQGSVNSNGAGSINNNVFTGSNQEGKATNKHLLSSVLNNNRSFSNSYATLRKGEIIFN